MGKPRCLERIMGEGGSETSANAKEKASGKPRRYRKIKPQQGEMRHMANSLRIGDSVSVRTPVAPAARYPTDSGTQLLGPSRTTITRAAPCGATHKELLMAFPKHPIIDVTPVDAARGAAAAAQAAAEPFTPPSFGKRVGKVDNQPLHTTFVDGRGNPVRNQGDAAAAASRLTGAAQTVAGAAVMAVGVPMLILPGPGVLAIGAGAAIAAGGIKKIRNGK